MLIDILFAFGTFGFLIADWRQFNKLRRNKYPTNAISRHHLVYKLLALTCVTIAYSISSLYVSFFISLSQLILTIGILYYTWRNYDEEI